MQVDFEVVERNTLLSGLRAEPGQPQWLNADALNIGLMSSDVSQMARRVLRYGLRAGDGARPGQDRRTAAHRA